MKKISYCIPVWNGGDLIGECIDSILAQDYPVHEIIVSDSGSTDNTKEVCESYGDKVQYHYIEKCPIFRNWNNALSKATGDYVKMMCHDDTITPDCTSKQLHQLETIYGSVLCGCARAVTGENITERIGGYNSGDKPYILDGKTAAFNLLKHWNYIGELAACLFKNNNYIVDENINHVGDMMLWMTILRDGSFVYIPEELMNFRQHPKNDSKRILAMPEYQQNEWADKQYLAKKFSILF